MSGSTSSVDLLHKFTLLFFCANPECALAHIGYSKQMLERIR